MSVTLPYTARGRLGNRSTYGLVGGSILYVKRVSGVNYAPRTVSTFVRGGLVCTPNGTMGTKNMTASNLRVDRGTVRVD